MAGRELGLEFIFNNISWCLEHFSTNCNCESYIPQSSIQAVNWEKRVNFFRITVLHKHYGN